MTVVYYVGGKIIGLAADTKPLSVPANSTFIESDTQKEFIFDGVSTWNQIVSTSPPFTPPDIAGLKLWLDASDSGTLNLTGSSVNAWNDKSGEANNFSQTGGARPTLAISFQNGLDVVRTNGTAQYMARASFTGGRITQGFTVFIALRKGSGAAAEYIFDSGTGQGTDRCLLHNAGIPNWAYFAGGTTQNVLPNNTTFVACTMQFNGAATLLRINGGEISNTTGGNNALNGLTLAARFTVANFGPNDFGEFLIYDTALSESDVIRVENYLIEKWGIV